MNPLFCTVGASYNSQTSEFTVWAPRAKNVSMLVEPSKGDDSRTYPMTQREHGYWKTAVKLPLGARYKYQLDGEATCPDPASLSQPDGVHGASELVNLHDFTWTDSEWEGLPLGSMIIYELHTGCFSPTHDFEGIIRRLDYLSDLGINAIELMPVAQFPGSRNWGYDGVFPFAVQFSYGGYRGLQQLVNEAHARGIAVIVDVVYNHFGPEGSYVENFGPYLTDKYVVPWGKAINYDDAWSDGVRNFFFQNARMWLEDFHVDGLRLDAVHAIKDFGAIHFMQQLKDLSSQIEARTGSKKILIAELDLNDPKYIDPVRENGYGLDGQWIDEFHHALRAFLTGDRSSYLEDFGTLADLEKAFTQTYVYNGNYSRHRKRTFGRKISNHPYSQFVVFAQNHDQIGNRALGDRLTTQVSLEAVKLAAAAVLLSPYTPLLFMGEEYGEKNPFQFFVSHSDPALIESVRTGRKKEFAGFIGDTAIPDPEAEETFLRSNLSWQYQTGEGSRLLAFYRYLIGLRKTRPALLNASRDGFVMHQASDNILFFERKGVDDSIFIWLHFGEDKKTVNNNTGFEIRKIVDSASKEWGGSESDESFIVSPGGNLLLSPLSASVFEKK